MKLEAFSKPFLLRVNSNCDLGIDGKHLVFTRNSAKNNWPEDACSFLANLPSKPWCLSLGLLYTIIAFIKNPIKSMLFHITERFN